MQLQIPTTLLRADIIVFLDRSAGQHASRTQFAINKQGVRTRTAARTMQSEQQNVPNKRRRIRKTKPPLPRLCDDVLYTIASKLSVTDLYSFYRASPKLAPIAAYELRRRKFNFVEDQADKYVLRRFMGDIGEHVRDLTTRIYSNSPMEKDPLQLCKNLQRVDVEFVYTTDSDGYTSRLYTSLGNVRELRIRKEVSDLHIRQMLEACSPINLRSLELRKIRNLSDYITCIPTHLRVLRIEENRLFHVAAFYAYLKSNPNLTELLLCVYYTTMKFEIAAITPYIQKVTKLKLYIVDVLGKQDCRDLAKLTQIEQLDVLVDGENFGEYLQHVSKLNTLRALYIVANVFLLPRSAYACFRKLNNLETIYILELSQTNKYFEDLVSALPPNVWAVESSQECHFNNKPKRMDQVSKANLFIVT